MSNIVTIAPIAAADAPQTDHRRYAPAVLLSGHQTLLFISGQVPFGPDGRLPADFEQQARLCWKNVFAQLDAARMRRENLVKLTVFLKRYEDRDANARIRFEVMGDHITALSTIITDVYEPDWLIEIEAIAAA